MKNSNKHLLKQSFISTIVGFIGCSIGSISAMLFLSNEDLFLVFLVAFGSGFVFGFLAILFHELFFRRTNLPDAFKLGYSLSMISIISIILSINIVFSFSHNYLPNHINSDLIYNLILLSTGIGLAFLVMIVYTFWKFKKMASLTNEIHH